MRDGCVSWPFRSFMGDGMNSLSIDIEDYREDNQKPNSIKMYIEGDCYTNITKKEMFDIIKKALYEFIGIKK